MSNPHTEELKPCRDCGAPCRAEAFPTYCGGPLDTTIWLCSQHKMFGGNCPSDTAYLTKEAWNTRTDQPPPHTGLTDVEFTPFTFNDSHDTVTRLTRLAEFVEQHKDAPRVAIHNMARLASDLRAAIAALLVSNRSGVE